MRNGMGVGLLMAISLGCAAGAPPAVPSGSAAGAFLAATPPTFSFGNVPVGTATTRDVVLSNTGTAAALITDVTVTGQGFSANGLPVPLTLGPGASRTLTVGFAPPAVGTFSGDVTLASNAADLVVIGPTGTGVSGGAPPAASITSVIVNPATVAAGQTVQMTAAVAAIGTIDKSVAWSLASGSLGSIDGATGIYTTPSTAGTYTVTATSVADPTKKGSGIVTVAAQSTSPGGVGTGTNYTPVSITGLTGGGSMPAVSNGYVASCVGDGSADDTACLQAAATTAAAQGKPLLIPFTASGYKITSPLNVATSVIGTGIAAPLIFMAAGNGSGGHTILLIWGYQGSGLWISGLHLRGTFTTTAPAGEWDHGIWIADSRNVTIGGNVVENVSGDAILLGRDSNLVATNIFIDNNTIRNPYRNGVGLAYSDHLWIGNNVIEKPYNYVSGVDFEPNVSPESNTNAEVAYNRFVMNNRTPGRYGSDGRAASAWQNASVSTPGGNLYLHHNYGTFGVGWWMPGISYKGGNGDWYNIVQSSNVEGDSIPN